MVVYQLVNEYKRLPEVEAITLAGSGANGRKDNYSDIDIDIIVSKEIDNDRRAQIIKKVSDYMEVGNDYWGAGDEFLLRSSDIQVDIAYFEMKWLKEQISNILDKNIACTGYSTCFWHNVKNAVIVYDRNGVFTELQKKCNTAYPEKLKSNIMKKNYPILRRSFSSYYNQITKALRRNDLVSVNHRLAAFIASYFDILFAINEIPHPGEKKLLDIVENQCKIKPDNFKENLDKVFIEGNDKILKNLDIIVDNLDVLLRKENIDI